MAVTNLSLGPLGAGPGPTNVPVMGRPLRAFAVTVALALLTVSLVIALATLLQPAFASLTAPVAPPAELAEEGSGAPLQPRPVLSAESIARAEAILSTPLPTPAPAAMRIVSERAAEDASTPAFAALAFQLTAAEPATEPYVDLDELEPLAVPAVRVARVIRPRVSGWQGDFIQSVGMIARSTYGSTHIPPSVTIAQAALDSGWGRSQLGAKYHNYFGIKAYGRGGSAGYVVLPTIEYERGQPVWVESAFRAYRSMVDGVADHHRFLLENPRYGVALTRGNDPSAFAWAIQRAGYATDPWYARKLISLMDTYDLYRYDQRD